VPEVFWFCWSDAMVSPLGVLDSSGNQKPAYSAYRSVAPSWNASCDQASAGRARLDLLLSAK